MSPAGQGTRGECMTACVRLDLAMRVRETCVLLQENACARCMCGRESRLHDFGMPAHIDAVPVDARRILADAALEVVLDLVAEARGDLQHLFVGDVRAENVDVVGRRLSA